MDIVEKIKLNVAVTKKDIDGNLEVDTAELIKKRILKGLENRVETVNAKKLRIEEALVEETRDE